MQSWKHLLRAAALVLCSTSLAPFAAADDYPSRTVRIVVPYAPGGVGDIAARLLSVKLSEYWKQGVVIDNKPGGAGLIGTDHVAKAAPDGYTLLMASAGEFSVSPHLSNKFQINPLKDFAPIVLVSDTPMVFAANINAPFNTLKEMMAYANAQQGGMPYASAGVGSLAHLVAERFVYETKTKLLHVPYKGGGPAGIALAGGEVLMASLASSSVNPYVKSGKVKVLAVAGLKRLSSAPDWPTVGESGLPGFEGGNWTALVAPAGTPKEIVAKINADANRALKTADTRERFTAVGSEALGSTSEEAAAKLRTDSERYGKLIREMKITVN